MTLFITKRARRNFQKIDDYIKKDFGENIAKEFQQKFDDFFGLLLNYPEIGSLELPEKNIRAFQIAKQTRVYYIIEGSEITILNIFDVRQSPGKRLK